METFYLITDQPTTCPICGARTEITGDFYHTLLRMFVNQCGDIKCKHVFLETV